MIRQEVYIALLRGISVYGAVQHMIRREVYIALLRGISVYGAA